MYVSCVLRFKGSVVFFERVLNSYLRYAIFMCVADHSLAVSYIDVFQSITYCIY